MKKIFLFSTKIYYFWALLPLIILFVSCIYLNNEVDGILKLYPLMTVTTGAIVFVLLFLIRGIQLTYDDARCVGIFSKKDYARLEKDYSLVITKLRHGRLLVEIYGFVDENGIGYDWYKEEDIKAEINLLRARTNGGFGTIKKILLYYGIEESEAKKIISDPNSFTETKDVTVVSAVNEENGLRSFRFTFKSLYNINEVTETTNQPIE